jgi:hypothetical protein
MVHENEQLKNRGETQLAAQWRDRYELCSQEKEELVEQIKMIQACSGISPESLVRTGSPSVNQNHSTTGHLTNSNDSFSLERAYMQLKEEYKVSVLCLTHMTPLCLFLSLSLLTLSGFSSQSDGLGTRERKETREAAA